MISVTIFLKAAPPRLTGRYAAPYYLLQARVVRAGYAEGPNAAQCPRGAPSLRKASKYRRCVCAILCVARQCGMSGTPRRTLHAHGVLSYVACDYVRSARYDMVCVADIRRRATVPVSIINKTQDYYYKSYYYKSNQELLL
jgi:hypothetical protein